VDRSVNVPRDAPYAADMTATPEALLMASVSKSPGGLGQTIWRAAYAAAEINGIYLKLHTDDFVSTVDSLWQLGASGFAVSMPFKIEAAAMAKDRSDAVEAIGAANLLVRDETSNGWSAHNTDWIGAMRALDDNAADVELTHAVVLGAGGAARALAYGLSQRGLRVDVIARRRGAAQQLIDDLQLSGHAYVIEDRDHIESADLVVNATADSTREGVVHFAEFPNAKVFFEVAAVPMVAGTSQDAQERGLIVVPGWQMMLHQAYEQWSIVTATDAPVDAMRDAALSKLRV